MGTFDVTQLVKQLNLPKHRAEALTVLAVVLGLASLYLPWYSLDDLSGGVHDPTRGYGLSDWTNSYSDGSRLVVPYDSIACRCASSAGVFLLSQLLAWGGVLLAAIVVTLQLRGRLKEDPSVVLTAIAGLLLIGAALSMAVMLPASFHQDNRSFEGLSPSTNTGDAANWGAVFVGSNQTAPGRIVSWGPSWGFALDVLGGLAALGSLPFRRKGPKALPAGATSWPTPAPPVGQAPVGPQPSQPQVPISGGYR